MTEGGCICGQVRYAADGISQIFKCHCSKCRKAFGGASSAAALIAEDQFCWLQGEDTIKLYESDSGFKRFFCPLCGSLLPQFVADGGLWWIPVGTLDSDPDASLSAHINVDSKANWEVIADGLPQFPGSFT